MGSAALTQKAREFRAANAESPVVYGSVQSRGGAYYLLLDGRAFRLTADECRSLPMARWLDPADYRDRDGGSAGDPERGSTAKQRQPGPKASPNSSSDNRSPS